jgi:hypothetical protein
MMSKIPNVAMLNLFFKLKDVFLGKSIPLDNNFIFEGKVLVDSTNKLCGRLCRVSFPEVIFHGSGKVGHASEVEGGKNSKGAGLDRLARYLYIHICTSMLGTNSSRQGI